MLSFFRRHPFLRGQVMVLGVAIVTALVFAGCNNPAGDGSPDGDTNVDPSSDGASETEILPAPLVDPGGGTFELAPTVTVSAVEEAEVIRYTLDGSEPDAESTPYEEAIQIPVSRDPVELRTRAFTAGDDDGGGVAAESYTVERGPTLTIEVVGAGTVTAAPDNRVYRWDETVSLTASPDEGYSFDGWSEEISEDNVNIDLLMDDHYAITASFVESGPAAAHALRGSIVINEVLPDPTGADGSVDTDGNGSAADQDEYVELYNAGDSEVDLAGMVLWDAGYGDWFTFPENSVLASEAHALIVGGVQEGGSLPDVPEDGLALHAERSGSVLNNGSDNVVLFDPETDSYVQLRYNGDDPDDPVADYAGFSSSAEIVDGVEDWGDDVDGVSLGRRPDGTGAAIVHSEDGGPAASPGTSNSIAP